MNQIIKLSFILIALGLTLFVIGCSKPHFGCSKREERQSARYFVKSVNKCQNEAMRQSLLFFPPIEKDSIWSDYVKGVDTVWLPSEKVEFDCDSFINWRNSQNKPSVKTKALIKCPDCPYTVDTVKKYKLTIQQDQRLLNLAKDKIAELEFKQSEMVSELNKKNVEIAKEKAAKRIYKWILISLFAVASSIVGIKFIIPKVLGKI